MSIDDVVDFTYKRNKLWQNVSKSDLKKMFLELASSTIVVRRGKKIKAVAVYVVRGGIPTFFSLTIDEKEDGYKLIKEFLRNNPKVGWINRAMRIGKCHK